MSCGSSSQCHQRDDVHPDDLGQCADIERENLPCNREWPQAGCLAATDLQLNHGSDTDLPGPCDAVRVGDEDCGAQRQPALQQPVEVTGTTIDVNGGVFAT
jgi:hypothetical protein